MDNTYTDRRRQTRSSVYHHLYDAEGFCTRQSVAQALGLSLPTIYQNLNELVESGLVRYNGEAESTGGRRAAGVEIVPDARIAIGVSVTGHHLRFLAADLRLHEIAYRSVSYTTFGTELTEVAETIARELESFIDGQEIDRSRLLGVCIAVPGVLTADHRRVMFAPTLHQTDADLSALHFISAFLDEV